MTIGENKATENYRENSEKSISIGVASVRVSGTLFPLRAVCFFCVRAFFFVFFVSRRSRLFVLGLAAIFGAGLCFVFADAMFLYWKFSICLSLVCIIIRGYKFE